MKALYLFALVALLASCKKDDPAPPVVTGPEPQLEAPTPMAPANGATNLSTPITFTWTEVPGAISYSLRANVYDNSPPGWFYVQNIEGTSYTYIAFLNSNIRGKEVTWDVKAVKGGNHSEFSDAMTFTLAP